jgi:hypothetical protein
MREGRDPDLWRQAAAQPAAVPIVPLSVLASLTVEARTAASAATATTSEAPQPAAAPAGPLVAGDAALGRRQYRTERRSRRYRGTDTDLSLYRDPENDIEPVPIDARVAVEAVADPPPTPGAAGRRGALQGAALVLAATAYGLSTLLVQGFVYWAGVLPALRAVLLAACVAVKLPWHSGDAEWLDGCEMWLGYASDLWLVFAGLLVCAGVEAWRSERERAGPWSDDD